MQCGLEISDRQFGTNNVSLMGQKGEGWLVDTAMVRLSKVEGKISPK